MKTRPFGHPGYGENDRRGGKKDSTPCAWCGKHIAPERQIAWVEVFDGGSRWARNDDDAAANEAARADGASYMAFFPVGSDCRRVLEKDGVVIRDIPSSE